MLQEKQKIRSSKKISWHGKRYNFFGDYLREKYKNRVLKLPVFGGFSCPNRDGTLSNKGCIFCSDDGSASPVIDENLSINKQLKTASESFSRSDSNTKFIAYFQSFTNTYGSIEKLKKCYDEAVSFENIIGLMIGTRPDCIDKNIARLISSYHLDEVWIELGMQTIHDKSLIFLNRGHLHQDTLNSIDVIREYNLKICLHVIIGIPGESWKDIMEIANSISKMDIQGIKIHHLHVIEGTELEKVYNNHDLSLQTYEKYISTLADFLERVRKDIVIHRISSDRDEKSLVAPKWGLHKGTVQKGLDDEFLKRGTWQGFFLD